MTVQTQVTTSGSISIAESSLGPTGASHSYTVFDIGGNITEMHGLATDRYGNPTPIGMPWDTTDTITYWDTASLQAGGYMPTWADHYLGSPQNIQTLFTGSAEEVAAMLAQARATGVSVNALGLDYMVLHLSTAE
ncbi:MAG: hypothetical protein H5U24_04955 [Thioclava marina]|uniref:hypothetical protein n=1 Tax=Thioclava marina TaxID=1915077 RepID=UPI001990EE36|nr:hypothetical protein [Thioclava marina]MBC7144738.1 hypothetical protein [Thioclava marina]